MDLGTQFCERCGRDRDSFASARNTYRDCPSCNAACCADCWNLVDGACLACAPFRLLDTAPPRIVVTPAAAAAPAGPADPYADLRAEEPALGAWDATRSTARQRPKDTAPAGETAALAAPDAWRAVLAESSPVATGRKRRHAGRIGLAASAAWVVVAGLAVVVLGASPQAVVLAPPAATPSAVPSPAATPAPVRPTATPRETRPWRPTPRPTPRVRPANPGWTVPQATPRATPRPAPRPTHRATPRPGKPVVVAPPTPRPTAPPTAAPTPTPELIP